MPVIIEELRSLLGAEAVSDSDARVAPHISGQDIGTPVCWVRPTTTEQVALVVRRAADLGARVVPVGAATAYWDPLRLGDVVALDTLALKTPFSVDEVARIALTGAGVSLREIDRAARRHGLCLAARPDAGGETPVGALVAVGSTAGLGLGIASPVELISGATVVTERGEIARLGASHALHGVPFSRHGAPERLGEVTAAEGRGAIITEVGLLLHRAPSIVTVRARGKAPLPRLLEIARAALDGNGLESYRIEVVERLEVMARTFTLESARELAAEWSAAGLTVGDPEIESEAARRGEDPDYEYHWAFPAGQHRARLAGGAMWGVEVGVSWRSIDACAARLWQLYSELRGVRRFALYPARHSITVGVQLVAHEKLQENIRKMRAALPELLAEGAVPYRTGNLWREALERSPSLDLDVDQIAERYRAIVTRGQSPLEEGPTPCLSLSMRPLPPSPVAGRLAPLVEPCSECGVAASCPASLVPASQPRPLRPLRHADPLAAALAATRAIAAAWDQRPPVVVEELLLKLVRERLGSRSLPAPPFEFSLKIADGQLTPRLRVVEYSSTGSWRSARSRERARSLLHYGEEWLHFVEARQPEGLEISVGFDAELDGSRLSTQLYAHVDPGSDRERLVRETIAWSAGVDQTLSFGELVLVAFCPRPDDPRRTKLYLSMPLSQTHEGLPAAELGELARYAPERGLAVLECGASGLRWRKRDFPCTVHFQRATSLPADFGRGLDERDSLRLQQILDGRAFAPWPTWLSVSPSERSLYFVPR
jgi:FAD/FMN-containing dehydrogenase